MNNLDFDVITGIPLMTDDAQIHNHVVQSEAKIWPLTPTSMDPNRKYPTDENILDITFSSL